MQIEVANSTAEQSAPENPPSNLKRYQDLIESPFEEHQSAPEQMETAPPIVQIVEQISDEEQQHLVLQAEALLEQGNIHEVASSYAEALHAYNEALEIYSKIQDARGIIKVYLLLAKIHFHQGDVEVSRTNCLEALTMSETNRYHLLKADALFQLGLVERKTGEYQIALERFQQSLRVAIERKDKFRQEKNLGSIGVIYESIGEYTIAIEHYKEALKIATEVGYKRNQSIHLANLGLIHEHLGDS